MKIKKMVHYVGSVVMDLTLEVEEDQEIFDNVMRWRELYRYAEATPAADWSLERPVMNIVLAGIFPSMAEQIEQARRLDKEHDGNA